MEQALAMEAQEGLALMGQLCRPDFANPRPLGQTLRAAGNQPREAWARAGPPLPRLEYCDEAVRDPSQAPPVDVHQPPAFLHKLLQLAGVRLHFEELPPQVGRPWSSLWLSPSNPCPLWPLTLPCSTSIPLTVLSRLALFVPCPPVSSCLPGRTCTASFADRQLLRVPGAHGETEAE